MQANNRPTLVVSTRIRPPARTNRLIVRDRLIRQLQTGRTKRLILIHGPAGFGKTSLALQWQDVLVSEGLPVAWLSLDRDDSDVHSFLAHLIAAVRRVEPALDPELQNLLEQSPNDSGRYVLSEFVNQIAERRRPLTIVLDDWHLVDNSETTSALRYLTLFGPDTLHLIVTSRTRAPATGHLRIRDEVIEIDAMELRFDQEESAAFFVDLHALELRNGDTEQLWSSTDGWVAAMQLATLSLRNATDRSALIMGFSGRNRSIGDYLTENVLDALPPHLYEFLLTTSICDRLCGDLATALSGHSRGQAILEELERRDLFLLSLDQNREWFRYHHLFAEYLRQRLERDQPDRIAQLHRTASDWFERHGLLSEFLRHALAAGDVERAVDIVQKQSMHLIEHSRMATFLGLVGKLPKDAITDRPGLQLAIAWANCLLHRTSEVQLALDNARASLEPLSDEASVELLREVDVVQACTDVYRDRIDRAQGLVSSYLGDNPRARPFLVAVSANILTFVDIHTFDYDQAHSRQRSAGRYHEASRGPFAGVYGQSFAGLAAFMQLDLVAAQRHYADAFALAQQAAGERSHAARLAGALLGSLLYEQGDTDTAERLLQDCYELGAESGVADFMIATYRTLSRIRLLRGDIDGALVVLREGRKVAQSFSLPRLVSAVDNEFVRVHVATGDIQHAQDVLDRHSADTATDLGMAGISMAIRHYRVRMQARILCAQHRYDGAYGALSAIRDETIRVGWRYAEVVNSLELARVKALEGDVDSATSLVGLTLSGIGHSGLVRTVIDAGPELLRVVANLREARRTDHWPAAVPEVSAEYLSKLLAAAHADGATAVVPTIAPAPSRMPVTEQPLNDRELAIMHLLGLGMPNKLIARKLNLSTNTIKWHLKNIYIKLGVTSRGESVAEARRRNILS